VRDWEFESGLEWMMLGRQLVVKECSSQCHYCTYDQINCIDTNGAALSECCCCMISPSRGFWRSWLLGSTGIALTSSSSSCHGGAR